MKIITYIILIILFSACGNNSNYVRETCKPLPYDSLTVKIDFPFISHYSQIYPYAEENDVYLAGYNNFTHSIDFIHLTNEGKHKSLPLQKEGNNAILPTSTIYPTNHGIIIKELQHIKLVSYQGKVLKSIGFKEISDKNNQSRYSMSNSGIAPGGYENIAYLKESNFVYLPLFPLNTKELKGCLIGSEINLNDSTISLIQSTYPHPYSNIKNNMGSYFRAQITALGEDKLAYNFSGSSDFWIWDKQKGETKRMEMPSQMTDNYVPFPPIDINAKQLFEEENKQLRFRQIEYIGSIKHFARVHYDAKQEIFDRNFSKYLILMKEDGSHIMEFKFPPTFDGRYFIHDSTLYFTLKSSSDMQLCIGKTYIPGIVSK